MWRNLLKKSILLALVGICLLIGYEARKPGRLPFQELRLLGADNSPIEQVVTTMEIRKGTNMLRIEPQTVRERLIELPWVRDARVSRQFPDILEVELLEKVAVATSREGEKLFLVDEYGLFIKPLESHERPILPVVTTLVDEKKRSERIVELMNLLGEHEWLKVRLSEAVGLPGHRWALYTRQGIKLLLSQMPQQELHLLRLLQKRFKILDRQVRQVDLRIAGVAVVRPLS
ncbi:MAG: FtsQ-type POTRA domain-containing protein [Magnetococcales bacterium]|nr:FtsQ-type POTRA domain-containing protein [Magnetococcales bacterium]